MVNINDLHQCYVTHTQNHIRHKNVHAMCFDFISESTKQGPEVITQPIKCLPHRMRP